MGNVISGTGGSVTLPATNIHNARIRAWSATLSHGVNDVTGFSQARWAANIGGLVGMSGSASGFLENDAANTSPGVGGSGTTAVVTVDSAAITLALESTTTKLAFNAVVTSISIGTSVDGVGTFAISFVSDGVVTETWDVT